MSSDDSNNTSWRHHFISQFYLAGFSPSGSVDDILWVTDLHQHKQWQDKPKNVGYEKHFNRIEVPGYAPDYMEKVWSDVLEGPAAEVIRNISELHELPDGEDRNVLMNLVAVFGIRGPRFRENIRRADEHVHSIILDYLRSDKDLFESIRDKMNAAREPSDEPLEDLSFEDFKEFVGTHDLKLEVPTTRHVFDEIDLLDTIVPLVHARKWTLMIAPDECEFITCDRPVALNWLPPYPRVYHSPGFGTENSELTFPLAKELALYGVFDGTNSVKNVDEETVNAINDRTVAFSTRFLYSASDEFSFSDASGRLRSVKSIIADAR